MFGSEHRVLGRLFNSSAASVVYQRQGRGVGTGLCLHLDKTPHSRLWLSVAQSFGHDLKTFGNPSLCGAGPLPLG